MSQILQNFAKFQKFQLDNLVDFEQNAYLLAKIGADTAENEEHFAEILPKLATTRWYGRYGRRGVVGRYQQFLQLSPTVQHFGCGVTGHSSTSEFNCTIKFRSGFTIRSKLVVVWAIVLCCCVSCRLLLMILTRDFRLLDEGSDAIWYVLFLMMTILTAYASVRYDRVTRSIYWYTFLREQLQRNAADRSRNVNARILDACNDITTPGASGKELQEALISAFAQFDKRPPGVAGIPEFRALVDHVLESGTTKKRRLKFQRRSLDNDTKIVFLCDLIIAREADMTNVSVGFQIVGVSNVSNA